MRAFKFTKRSPLEKFRLKDILIYHGRFIYYHDEIVDKNQLLVPPDLDVMGFALDNSKTEYNYLGDNQFHLETYLYVYHPELGWSDEPVAFSTLRELNKQILTLKPAEPFPIYCLYPLAVTFILGGLIGFDFITADTAIVLLCTWLVFDLVFPTVKKWFKQVKHH